MTDLLHCDSYLRRSHGYFSGISSGLVCPARHYASSLKDCKRWAVYSTCQVQSPHEKARLKERHKRSSVVCHMGLGDIPRLLYEAFRGDCDDSPDLSGLMWILKGFAKVMGDSHELLKVVNGNVTYLTKTTDHLN